MVLMHVTDAWTVEPAKHSVAYFRLSFVGGVASALFLFLAGLATAMSAASKGRREHSHDAGAVAARRRGWQIFVLGLAFRVQAQLLGAGPLYNIFRVDMLNTMGLAIIVASTLWQAAPRRRTRIALFACLTTVITMTTPLVRTAGWLSALPDPLEAYLRPAGPYAAFPMFPWAGFLFAGVIVGDLIDAVRGSKRRELVLQAATATMAVAGVWLAWRASFAPSIYPQADFWHSSPTLFFIRLGLVALTVPLSWLIELASEAVHSRAWLQPLATLGRSSLFVYWIHVEMVYGVLAESVKGQLPLAGSLVGTAMMSLFLYFVVLLKNRLLQRYGLPGPFRILEPVVR
jgi:acyltransferase